MPAKKKLEKAARSFERRQAHKGYKTKDYALQPPGQPQGKHLSGFKGMKIDLTCLCGRCNPKAQANHGRPRTLKVGNC